MIEASGFHGGMFLLVAQSSLGDRRAKNSLLPVYFAVALRCSQSFEDSKQGFNSRRRRYLIRRGRCIISRIDLTLVGPEENRQ
jgi:hypothetical protein